LIVFVTKVMGASTWSWGLTLLVAGLLVLPPVILSLLSTSEDKQRPLEGGSVVLLPGRGVHGGADGRIVLVGGASPTSGPMLTFSWRNSLDVADSFVDVYVTPGWMPFKARPGSLLLTLDDLRLYRRDLDGRWLGSDELLPSSTTDSRCP
jgi:hypothetical protein